MDYPLGVKNVRANEPNISEKVREGISDSKIVIDCSMVLKRSFVVSAESGKKRMSSI